MMKTAKKNVMRILITIWIGLFIQLYDATPIQAASFSEEQKQDIQEQAKDSIRIAEKLLREGKQSESLRRLYDAAKEETAAQLPGEARYKAYQMIQSLIHEDESPLMQYLRNREIPISEKNALLLELSTLVASETDLEKDAFLKRKLTGPFIDILTSSQLTREEKQQIVQQIIFEVRKNYISEEQKELIVREILQDLTLAEQQFQQTHYAATFRVILDAGKNALEAGVVSQASDYYHEYLDWIAVKDTSSLMIFLRDTKISWQKKQKLFNALEGLVDNLEVANEQRVLLKQYDGSIIELMSDPILDIHEKRHILQYLQEVIQKEYSPLP